MVRVFFGEFFWSLLALCVAANKTKQTNEQQQK
jgi:hypothetical protein